MEIISFILLTISTIVLAIIPITFDQRIEDWGEIIKKLKYHINETEFSNLKSQFATSSWGGKRKLPFVFTEQGVAMLSGMLNSDRAIEVNIQIMRIFTKIRQTLMDNTELRLAIEEIRQKTDNNTKNIELVFHYLDELLDKKENREKRKPIGYQIP